MGLDQARKIMVVDDTEINRRLLTSIINKNTEFEVITVSNGKIAVDTIRNDMPDLILLDVMMPEMDGFEVARILKASPETENIPIIFITALDNIDDKVLAFELGGADYITKPFNSQEVISRIRTQMKLKSLVDGLGKEVEKRTEELAQLNMVLVSALESANYYNDDDTGNHIQRVSYYSKMIAAELGMEQSDVDEIFRYASLHDIGKVGIPDQILKKRGKLDPDEWEIMKSHSQIGFDILNHPGVSDIAKNIVLYHHEKFDGTGYPEGLKGRDIPLEARIVALADVYDALRSRRPYKEAFSREDSTKIILESSGSHFDPEIVEAFKKTHPKLEAVFDELKE